MAAPTFPEYLREINGALLERNGWYLSDLLSLQEEHVSNTLLHVNRAEGQVHQWLEQPWEEITTSHIKCMLCLNKEDFIECYASQTNLINAFLRYFTNQKDENWALPLLYSIVIDLRLLAYQADGQLARKRAGKPGETLEKAAESIMGCFRACASDSRASIEESKKWGMLTIVNQLFKIYFRINKLHLCKPLIRAIEGSNIKDKFSLAQMVTYRYFIGRKAMFESNYKEAEEYLTFAFQRCHKECKKNKRLILIYLIPVKMLLGHMPSAELLKKYNLTAFSDVTRATCSGNLLLLNQALEQNGPFFMTFGVYLILEKLKILTYRNLLKKVCLLLKTHQVPLDSFVEALKAMQVDDVDIDEASCIVANLIYEGYVKGYISHQHKKLVISKQNAFPTLSTVL